MIDARDVKTVDIPGLPPGGPELSALPRDTARDRAGFVFLAPTCGNCQKAQRHVNGKRLCRWMGHPVPVHGYCPQHEREAQ